MPLFVEATIKPKIKQYVITDEDFAQSEDGLWATVKNLDDIPELKILYIKEFNPVFNAQVEIYVNLEKTPSAINTLGVFAPDRNASKISQPKNTNQPFSLRASCNVV